MIAADTSSLSAYLSGQNGPDIVLLASHLAADKLWLPPAVFSEAWSAPGLTAEAEVTLLNVPLLPVTDGYWERVGAARRKLRAIGLRARLGDALIAQVCLDADMALITRDSDFRHYATHCGLKLA